ncbi:hypothetical protein KCP78_05065 [Salmonella enterica subsp. enterica]|nr:hypothetical protein KCP78_05065 [Salmonella enterica subsp. enterica]
MPCAGHIREHYVCDFTISRFLRLLIRYSISSAANGASKSFKLQTIQNGSSEAISQKLAFIHSLTTSHIAIGSDFIDLPALRQCILPSVVRYRRFILLNSGVLL